VPRIDLIQLRSDTTANWTSVNPILAVGEQGFETDTGKFKIGTGSTAWNNLLYTTDSFSDLLPRGVMAYDMVTSSDSTVTTTEEVQIIGSAFTAISTRYYKVTYYEPNIYGGGSNNYMKLRIRSTNLTGTERQMATPLVAAVYTGAFVVSIVVTGLSGTPNFVATAQANSGTNSCVRSATQVAYLLVEDIGAVSNNNNN
jgi:hypothetical protein